MSHHEPPRSAAYLPFEPLLPLVAFDEHEDAATSAHLATCPYCQREVASYAALRATLRRELEPEPAHRWVTRPTTMDEIMRATQETEQEQGILSRTPLPVRHSRATTLWGGLVTALVIVGVALLAMRLSPTAPVSGGELLSQFLRRSRCSSLRYRHP
jgi:anti-sigma factor RsiW